jgi:uncharacterized protein involved in outer membrane biogenesis
MWPPKIKFQKKYIKIGAWICGVFLFLLLSLGAIAYNKRDALLKKIIAKAVDKAEKDYGLTVKIEAAGFSGLSAVAFKNISIVPKDRDTLSTIKEVTIGVKIFPLLFGDVKLSKINLSEGSVNVVWRDSLSNIDFILKKKNKDRKIKE